MTPGIIMEESSRENMVFLPLNLSFAKEYPASAPRKILVSTPATARNREFIKYLPKGIVSNTLV